MIILLNSSMTMLKLSKTLLTFNIGKTPVITFGCCFGVIIVSSRLMINYKECRIDYI